MLRKRRHTTDRRERPAITRLSQLSKCRFYSKNPHPGKTFSAPSAIRAFAFIGSARLQPSARPCVRSFTVNCGINTPTTPQPPRIRSSHSTFRNGPARHNTQAPPSSAASPRYAEPLPSAASRAERLNKVRRTTSNTEQSSVLSLGSGRQCDGPLFVPTISKWRSLLNGEDSLDKKDRGG